MGGAGVFTRLFSILLAVILITAPLSSAVSTGYGRDEEKKDDNDKNADDTDIPVPEDSQAEDKKDDNFTETGTVNDTKYTSKKDDKEEEEENSRQKLKNRLGSLQPDPSSPLALKQQAYGNILSIVPSGNEENKDITRKLDKARLHIEESIAGMLWYDGTRLRPVMEQDDDDDRTEIEEDDDEQEQDDEPGYDAETSVFKAEKTAAQNIMEVISKNKENATYDDILIEAVVNLIQADRNIAGIAIADAWRAASLYGADLQENDDEKHRDIEKAQKEFDKAVEKVQKGEPIDAIEHFEDAWEHATSGLFMLDAATRPVIIFDSINSRYVNRTTINLSGHVEDAAVYTLSNITLEVNGIRSTLDLTGGVFKTDIGLNEGINHINATATDNFGNTGANNITLIVDTVPPVISYSGAEDGRYYNSSISITANMTDENPDTLVILVNGNPYTQDAPIIIEGDYRVDIIASDLAGNTAGSSFTFHIDMTPPAIRILKPANGSFISGTAEVNFTVSDASPISTFAAIDDTDTIAGPFDSTAYPDGDHYIAVSVVDAAGNAARETVSFTVDNTPPDVSILEPGNNEAIKGLREIIARVYDLYLKGVTIFINNKPVSDSVNHTFDTLNYPDGSYNISAEGVDLANNTGYGSISVIVDNTPPEVNITSPANGSFVKQQVTVNANITEANPATTDVRIDGISASGALPYLLDTLSYPDGMHAIEVYARDRAGNEGSGNVLITVDNTPPQVNITSPVNGSYARGHVNITAEAYDANIANVSLAINGIQVSNTSIHAWNTTGYPDGWHRITAVVSDRVMNTAQKEVWVQVDNTPPALNVTELTDNPTLENPAYRINGTVEPGAVLTINGSAVPHSGSFEYRTNLTEGTNIITVTATDAAGNTASWTKTRLVDTDNLPDHYEINVTGTDPLNGDSDSSKTAKNEAGNGIKDHIEDFDDDALATYAEYKLRSNPFKADTDGDTLEDAYELLATGTSLLVPDTDGNGINDPAEDADNDKLTNLDEQALRTNPRNPDTDRDDISDRDETKSYHTNPLNKDTDEDELTDDIEIALGNSNPLVPDTDGDGIPDGRDSFQQEFTNTSIGASIQILGSGNLQKTMDIRKDDSPYVPVAMLSGIVSDFIDFNASSSFESATVRVYYNESRLNGSDESGLKLYYFDETSNLPVEAPGQQMNMVSNYIEAQTNHLSMWFIASNTYWAAQSNVQWNHPDIIYSVGDKINIKAVVHNTGDSAFSDNVLVYFYAGDPDAGGNYLGSATITGGISQAGSKTAVLYGYTISSSAVDIYVKVDPQNTIAEKSESNNKAYKTLSIGPQNFDSDGDGLTDAEETGGMQILYPYRAVYTDPNDDDTDDDGLSDREEMGAIAYYSSGKPYYSIISYADIADSDNDELDDFEEVRQTQTIYVADTLTKAQGFIKAVYEDVDSSPYLTAVVTTSNPLRADTDWDTIPDGEEIIMGTDPNNRDSDNDGIDDNKEEGYGEDPTIFDITPPTITVDYMLVSKDPFSFTAKYNFWYTISDYGGVKDVALLKNDIQRDGYSYITRITTVSEHTYFETTWETILDELRTARVDINTNDWNGNYETALVYHRPSMYGQMAAKLGSDTIYGYEIAGDLGMLSGLSATVAEIPELVILIGDDPPGFLAGITDLAGSIASDPVLLANLVSSLPESVKEKQKLENPYAVGTTLHDRFAVGWYSGYLAGQISIMVVGGEAVKSVTSSKQFAQLTGTALAKIYKIKELLKVSLGWGIKGKVAYFIEKSYASLQLPLDFFGKIKTAAKLDIAIKQVKKLIGISYDGRWSPGKPGNALDNFVEHYETHVVKRFEWDEIITPEAYRQKAINLINKKEGVEIYYQPGKQNMVVYDRTARELAIGNAQGEIQTLFRPDSGYIEKEVIKGTMIRINVV